MLSSARFLTLCIIGWLFAAPASAQIHRCTDVSGKVRFSDRPCAGNEAGRVVEVFDNRIEAQSLREQMLERQVREAREAEQRSQAELRQRARQARAAERAAAKAEARAECEAAVRQAEFTDSATRSFSPANRQRELRLAERERRRACASR